jgi:MYXO-CTERM domain-containing protein
MRVSRLIVVALLASATAHADDVIHVTLPALDPPTLVALGVSLPITGDDNFNATVAVRYRVTGTSTWHDALPLFHVHAEAVQGLAVNTQFAGSIFDLRPDTAYDIELHATDVDGAVDTTLMANARTRPVPIADPAHPRAVAVTTAAALTAALAAAQPGDVITLADGTYAGTFAIHASGTAADPIVIRGATTNGTILDGGGCSACNVLEIYGSFVHLESLTLQHASRALKFQTAATTDNVVRRLHIRDVITGISSQPDEQNFYIADNVLEGRLVWPCVYTSDDTACNGSPVVHGAHANDDGIQVIGDGHVVAHNRISGFGDAIKTEQDGAVSIDFYGNDVLWSYDNGIELDGSARNTRAFRNRFTNTFATLSFQPIFGGPAYAFRNVLVNTPDEPFKLHSNGSTPTVGAVIVHNTVVRGQREIQCSSNISPLYFTVINNLFLGPSSLDPDLHAVRWDLPGIGTASIDYNGYFPDGQFEYGYGGTGMTYPSFAAAMAAGGFDAHSLLVSATTLASSALGPADPSVMLAPMNPTLAAGSPAIDRAVPLANLDDGFQGAAPDLGALEAGCDPPSYGVRAIGIDESNEVVVCPMGGDNGNDGSPGGDAGTGGGSNSGCGCGASPPPGGALWLLGATLLLLLRRRGPRHSAR